MRWAWRALGTLILAQAVGCVAKPGPPAEPLRLAVPYDPPGLDPQRWDTIGSIAVALHFYEGLVGLDHDLRIQAGLAVSWENPDLNTWRLHLRPGVKFHGGKPFTSRDVVYSFERVRHDPSLEMSVYAEDVAEVSALDALTVEFKTKRPSSPFLNKIRLVLVVPEGSDATSLADREDGTGPYRLAQWRKGEAVRLVRNEEYWGVKPFARDAELQLATTPERAQSAIRSGGVDLVQLASKPLEKQAAAAGRFRIARSDSIFVKYLEFNLAAEKDAAGRPNLFRNKLYRQAIALALDRDALVKRLPNDAVATAQPVPPFIFGYDPARQPGAPEPARAATLARQAGATPDAPPVMHVRESFADAGRLLEQQLSAAGVPIRAEIVADDTLFDLRARGELFASLSRFGCMSGDASDLMEYVLYSPDRAGLLDAATRARFAHPALSTGQPLPPIGDFMEHRREGLQKVAAMLLEQLVLLPLYEDRDAYAVSTRYAWEPRHDDLVLAAEVREAAPLPARAAGQ